MRKLDLTGQRFGRLVAIEQVAKRGAKNRWRCACDCGGESISDVHSLTSGGSQSCGCYKRDQTVAARTKHGASFTNEYRIWAGILQRCYTPTCVGYRNYGGRGISVCEAWRHDFAAFLTDMGPRPGPRYSIDRFPDKDGNYEPGNCRWATDSEQAANKRNNRPLTFNGVTKPLTAWARELGMRHASLRERLDAGMSVEEALTKPTRSPKMLTFLGETMKAQDWANRLGLPYSTVRARLRQLPLDEALDVSRIRRRTA